MRLIAYLLMAVGSVALFAAIALAYLAIFHVGPHQELFNASCLTFIIAFPSCLLGGVLWTES